MVSIPGYDDLAEIGRGGFATVYRGRQEAFDRTVAIKVVHAAGTDERGMERFLRECRAAGSLSWHPGVVTVYDAGETDEGDPYLVMEHLAQGTIAERAPLPWREAVEIGIGIADALQAAHEARLIHRDVKPENILVGRDGRPMLADFGIAALEEGESLTRTGQVTASVRHAPPEVLDGKGARRASDIWSLASTIHALIRGQAPFVTGVDDTLIPLITRIAREEPPDLSPYGVPEAVQVVLRRAMAKDPDERWASAATFAEALRQARDPATQVRLTVAHELAEARPPRPSGGPDSATRRGWRLPVLIGLLAVVVVAAAFLGLRATGGNDPPAVATIAPTAPPSPQPVTAAPPPPTPPSDTDGPAALTTIQEARALAAPLPPAPTGGPVPASATAGDVVPAGERDLGGPMDIAIDPDGAAFIGLPGEQIVVRIDPEGTVATLAGTGTPCNYDERGLNVPATEAILCGPERLAIAPDGTLLIADVFHQLVRRVDGAGVISDVAGAGPAGPFRAIGGVTVRGDELWVSDFELGEVYVGAGVGPQRAVGGLSEPRGLTWHPLRDSILVADAVGRIVEITADATSTFIGRAAPTAPAADDPIGNPWDVDVGPDGRVWIADPGTNSVRYQDPNGPLTRVPVDFDEPIGVAVHPDGSVYVADGRIGRIWRILPDLTTVEPVAGLG